MSLSDRWSFFRTVKSEEEKESQQCNDDEVVVSMMHTVQDQQQQHQTVDANTNADANTENVINAYLHETCLSQARLSEEARWQKEWQKGHQQEQQPEQQQESCEYTYNNVETRNSHYKGLFTETMPTMPVLFIEENIPSAEFKKVRKNVTDWRAYVYYDSYKNVYILNGTRRRSDESGMERRYPDIHMSFRSKSALAFFLRRSMCSWRHNLSITMYSMYRSVIHLSTPGATPSFHSIHNCRSKFRSELFGYDDCRMSMKEFESYLKMLKEIGDDGLRFRPLNC